MSLTIDRMPLRLEPDIVTARQRARQIAGLLGFDNQDQSRIATAVSEIARNAIRYAHGGIVEYHVEGDHPPQLLMISIADRGPGIADMQSILDGRYRSRTGMGLGIRGARRLMDQCDIRSSSAGTVVLMKKLLDAGSAPVTSSGIDAIRATLAGNSASSPVEELQQQQRELLVALAEARDRQDQLTRLNRELEDTNRGVVALYAELDEKADHLRRADEMKSRFLSNMSHEFRTPLNSIRALLRLLLDRADGPLTDEQERQVGFIRKAADDLSSLVEDLLDLARIEAGKLEIHPADFTVDELFSALRGMLRPLLVGDTVALRFEPVIGTQPLYTDEAKVSQILRNFISNALKFTEQGAVTVSVACAPDEASIEFCVADTGIGIMPDDQERIFEEFVQLRGHLQSRSKGTGLGLPLCRRLAHALHGSVRVESDPGRGSRFFLSLPWRYEDAPEVVAAKLPVHADSEPWRIPVLIVEDAPEMQLFYEKVLGPTPYQPVAARTLAEATAALDRARPAAVILDTLLRNEDAWRWLAEVKSAPAETRAIPVLVITTVPEERKALALGADAFFQKPVDRAALLESLNRVTGSRVLIIDDDAAARYALRKLLDASDYRVLEAVNGEDGVRAAESAMPESIVLDLGLPDVDGFGVLERLKASEAMKDIPVIVATSRDLTDAERAALEVKAFAVLTKHDLLGSVVAAVGAASRQESWQEVPR